MEATQSVSSHSTKAAQSHEPPAWRGFKAGRWTESIDVRDFIQLNYAPYEGDGSFVTGPSPRTQTLWTKLLGLLEAERKAGGVLDADDTVVSGVASHGAGYIDEALEQIVGVQTDAPLKRSMMPYGGLRIAAKALQAHGRTMNPEVFDFFRQHRKTHNDGVFDGYTSDIRKARSAHIVTGLPDGYGRGRIIGDFRRVALYGVHRLIEDKKATLDEMESEVFSEAWIREREEINEQIRALKEMVQMAQAYGIDISRPAETAQEAVQWTYFGYLATVKEQNGAAMSLGRVSTFFDVYVARDLATGRITETEAQELIDHLVMKLRIVRFIRTKEYDELFSGDPTWVTESIGGMGEDGRTLVTRSSFRMLQTLRNLGPAPEPNLTVLWSQALPTGFKNFCSQISAETSSIQYESDDLMRGYWGDDYGIACCVSAMRIGKQMQFFGARANLAKAMLYAINGGRDEKTGEQIAPKSEPFQGEYLDYDDLRTRFDKTQDWLAETYMKALNVIHAMHDKYSYERAAMALHDREVLRTMACGIAGLSVVADSLSAVKHAKVKVLRNADGLAVDFETEGQFPCFGNNDPAVDGLAQEVVSGFMEKLRRQPTYRGATPTQSVLTITSNVVYGNATGSTPDGRKSGEPFAPGANPMSGRDLHGAVASMASVATLPYAASQDGISYTFSIVPKALGRDEQSRTQNLVSLLDGYFKEGGQHINVNVLNRETLLDAMERPEEYPQLTIRVSGYAVNFIKLTREQQMDVINRTFHASA